MRTQTGYDDEKLRKLTAKELAGEATRILEMYGSNSIGQPLSKRKREERLEETATEILRENGFAWNGEPITEEDIN